MGVRRWVGVGLKALGERVLRGSVGGNWFAQSGSRGWGRTLPGAGYDYEGLAGDPLENSAVAICVGWLMDNFPEPALTVTRPRDGGREPLGSHALLDLVGRPNDYYDGDTLWAATAAVYALHGNAFWYKARSAGGEGPVRELWFLDPYCMRPWRAPKEPGLVTRWVWQRGDSEQTFAREDVIQFRCGFDRDEPALGMSRWGVQAREIVSDNESSTFTAALLRNGGAGSVLISPRDRDTVVSPDQVESLREQFQSRVTGEGRGKPIIAGVGVSVEPVGFSPEQLALDRIRRVPEARICAALRLPAMVVGLTVGEEQRTYSNYREARRAAYEDCLQPMQRRFARTLDVQLLSELGRSGERVGWDYSEVAALQDERMSVYRQSTLGVRGGWMRVNEARARAGLQRDPGGDIYLRGGAGSPGDPTALPQVSDGSRSEGVGSNGKVVV